MNICLFDIDGTLIATGGAGKSAMEDALRSEFGITQVRDGVPFSGRTDRAIGRDLFQLHGLEESPCGWERFTAGYLRHLPRCLASHPGRLLPGIAELLRQLSARDDVLVGLLTGNLRAGARIKLSHFEIYNHFAVGGFGDHHFDRNDVAREAYEVVHCHTSGKCDRDRIWIIGDTPLDIRCARAIGARVAAVGTGWHSLEELASATPDLLLPDLSDPTPLFDHWR